MKETIGEAAPSFENQRPQPSAELPAPSVEIMESIQRTLTDHNVAVDLDRGGGS